MKNWFSEARREENDKILAAQQFYKDKVLHKCFATWKQVPIARSSVRLREAFIVIAFLFCFGLLIDHLST